MKSINIPDDAIISRICYLQYAVIELNTACLAVTGYPVIKLNLDNEIRKI